MQPHHQAFGCHRKRKQISRSSIPNKSISNSESVRSTSLKSTVDHDVLYEEFEAFMKSQRDLNNKLKVKGVHYLGEDLEQKC